MAEGEVQIRFHSVDFPAANSQSISIPTATTPNQLKSLFLGLADSSAAKSAEFDFLICSQVVRSNVAGHLKDHEIETDNELEVIVIKKQSAPTPENSHQAEDWISDLASMGDRVLAASYDGTVALWDASEEEIIFQVVCSSNVDNADPLKCCAWINDRSSEVLEFATGGIDAGLTIWRWNSEVNKKPVPVYSLRGHHGSVETVTAATENVICSAGQDKKVNIWKEISKSEETPDETSGKKRAKREARGEIKTTDTKLEGHSEAVTCSGMIGKNELATGGMDNTLRIWDLEKLDESNTLNGVKAFLALDYSAKSKLIATGSSDRHVRLWDPRTTTGKVSATSLSHHTLWVSAVKWSPTAEFQLLSGSYDNVLKLWDVRSTKTPLYDMQKHNDKILCVDWSESNLVFSGGSDQMIHSYRVSSS